MITRMNLSIVTNSRHYHISKLFCNQTITPRVERYLRRMSVVTGRSSCRGLMVISQMTNSFNHQSKKMIFDDTNTAKHWRHPSINKATMKFIYGYNCIYLYRTILTICFCVFWRVFNIINDYKIIVAMRLTVKLRIFLNQYPERNELRTYCC